MRINGLFWNEWKQHPSADFPSWVQGENGFKMRTMSWFVNMEQVRPWCVQGCGQKSQDGGHNSAVKAVLFKIYKLKHNRTLIAP